MQQPGSGLRILVIGGGGREHALAWRLAQSPSVAEVTLCPGNPAIPDLESVSGEPKAVALDRRPDLVVVGPEAPLCAGLADELRAAGLAVYGPGAAAARLEGSKAFMKEFCKRHGISTAAFEVVRSAEEVRAALDRFSARGEVPVVKADGLCAGKGVVVAETAEEALSASLEMLEGRFGDAGRTIVLEARLPGAEASVHAICDGERVLMLPAAQDHKRIGEGDRGPNTGGMGTYAPAPLVDAALLDRVREEVVMPVIRGMQQEGSPFVGTLFVGLMVSPAGEPEVLEFNVRFGDPETQVLMATLDGDLGRLLLSAAQGALRPEVVTVSSRHAMCVVMAAHGYPETPRKGDVIEGLEQAAEVEGSAVFHAGTSLRDGRVVTAGGRVLGVTATAADLAQARERAYTAVERIRFAGMQFRRDIGYRALGKV
ncbi:MAG: phosphoribosylamine--glycine ligase [Polyangiaceae bacterium]|nr:phosphoribosylamine--glycine ligase [Polyangiaceae bacterium]MCB9606991.1 phosphoribosylamine--glycine ligase [Polyangiaceae bacterium]